MKGGELLTKPLIFSGGELSLNFSSSAAGDVRVEIQNSEGDPFPGYSLDECPPIYGDSVARTVSWIGGKEVGSLAGKPVRLRFSLKDADLYSFQFQPDN